MFAFARHARHLTRYVNEVLVPTLSPRDIVLIDNLGSRPKIRKAIEAKGAKRSVELPHTRLNDEYTK